VFGKLFKRKKEPPKELLCDLCGKSVYLTAELTPLGVYVGYSEGKIYTVCGFCQYRLGLKATKEGFLYHETRNGKSVVDMDKFHQAINEFKSDSGKSET
jgi:hypothetical protein